jgi:hypothetical protein
MRMLRLRAGRCPWRKTAAPEHLPGAERSALKQELGALAERLVDELGDAVTNWDLVREWVDELHLRAPMRRGGRFRRVVCR